MASKVTKILGVAAGRGARKPGAEDGPWELRERGLVRHLVMAGLRVEDLGDIPGVYETRYAPNTTRNVNNLPNILQVNRHIHACVLGVRQHPSTDFLLVIGGDHSLAIGTIAGLADSCQRLGLIWIDAHADFNTPESSPSGNIHGMSLAVCCGHGPRYLKEIADRDPMVAESDVYLLGPRDLDPAEDRLLRASHVHFLDTDQWRSRSIVATALAAAEDLATRCDHIHLSFDIDVMDSSLVAGTGTPVAGGLQRDEALELLRALGNRRLISSAEFVEYNPLLDPKGQTADLALALIESLLVPPAA